MFDVNTRYQTVVKRPFSGKARYKLNLQIKSKEIGKFTQCEISDEVYLPKSTIIIQLGKDR